MEEAYTALYQEFLRLQLLCLKQAEMLRHLTEALMTQQGVPPVVNGSLEDLYSKVDQNGCDGSGSFTHTEDPAHARSQVVLTHTPANLTHTPAVPPAGVPGDPVVSLLPGVFNRLHLAPMQEEVSGASSAAGRCDAHEGTILEELRQVEQRWCSSQAPKQQQQQWRPWSSSFLTSEMLSEAGGMLMSRVTLHSQVCEFCQAVFPGHTTTRGEFLRHLTTHIH